jgi:hypothetical protein
MVLRRVVAAALLLVEAVLSAELRERQPEYRNELLDDVGMQVP